MRIRGEVGDGDWHFEAVFVYGEHPDDAPSESGPWGVRADPFSSYRAGFEVRTYRLVRRILMFHRFDELGAEPVLVRSTALTYDHAPSVTKLVRVEQRGHRGGTTLAAPPVDLAYSDLVWDERLHVVDAGPSLATS